METYTNRRTEQHIVASVELDEGGWTRVETKEHSGFAFVPDVHMPVLAEGDVFLLETQQVSRVTGVQLMGVWLMRKSDQQLAAEHVEFVENMKREHRERLAKNREKWQAREDALPDWIKERITAFHESGGENFREEGWAYELVIAELAVMYRESNGEESPSISEFARLHGTSGHQHATARVLASTSLSVSLAGTSGALTPLGADPLYRERN
jgi:hypothetical protein